MLFLYIFPRLSEWKFEADGDGNMLFGLLRRSETPGAGGSDYALAEAARRALEIARRERLPLTAIAEQNGPSAAQHWFAANILRIVLVWGRRPDHPDLEPLTREKSQNLTLDDDMASLRAGNDDEPAYVDLSLTAREFKKYVRWMRQVQ